MLRSTLLDTWADAPPAREPRTGLLPWVGRGMLAMAEQGAVSGSNFVVNILLARWLLPAQYGAYALAFSAFLVLGSVYQALVMEPMSVLGPIHYRGCLRGYLGALLRIHAGLSLLIAATVACGAFLAGKLAGGSGMGGALAGLALAAPGILLFWLARSAVFLEFSSRTIAASAVVYSALLLGTVVAASWTSILTPFTTFLLMMFAGIVASALVWRRLCHSGGGELALRDVWNRHWNYGRWEMGSVILNGLGQNVSYAITGTLLGMGEVGAVRALMNFGLPLAHACAALRRVAQPYVSGVSGRKGHSATRGPVRMLSTVYAVVGLVFFLFLTVSGERVVRTLYAGHFAAFAHLVPLVSLSAALSAATSGLTVGLRAMQSPSSLFAVDGTVGAVSLAAGIPAAWQFGVAGVIWTSVLSNLVGLIIAFWLYRRKISAATDAAEPAR